MAPSGLSGLFGSSETSSITEPAVTAVPASSATESFSEDESPAADHPTSVIAPDIAVLSGTTAAKVVDKDHILVSKSAYLILLSYASAITIGFLYLLYHGSVNKNDYGVESLPDIAPKKTSRASIYDERAIMPDGHDLRIGDSQRFGNIKVTVQRVTRGPIRFRHFSDSRKNRLPSSPVLKLWLRFENVSDNQDIAPLDDHLLFSRGGKNRFEYRSNQFVCRADDKFNPDAKRVIAFDHIIGSEFDLADMQLDKPLKPGESRDYYVPTCENDLDKLTGELLWRVHIRKGFSGRGNGVTTLFEVHFDSHDIRDETA